MSDYEPLNGHAQPLHNKVDPFSTNELACIAASILLVSLLTIAAIVISVTKIDL